MFSFLFRGELGGIVDVFFPDVPEGAAIGEHFALMQPENTRPPEHNDEDR
ncbi:hypothetical protein MRS76_00020 [Rhizobiaceae bacterium n13]|uniref:Uncharacterized protein n=1 Tax=Ferirhizobium litorale TaxID=2927786 RepID=A0AAE3QC34_9HYPH|nr:hypothetical protein [Fererhizobium litorale]MDI7860329.1 hypothetical protein [Fererhizobium litorale]MDI7920464.1 hypothetical protein [Fererhizobium litorale]